MSLSIEYLVLLRLEGDKFYRKRVGQNIAQNTLHSLLWAVRYSAKSREGQNYTQDEWLQTAVFEGGSAA
jgi:hypothetical protein